MKNKNLKIPTILIAIGLLAAIVACILTCMVREPAITEHDFHYSVTYRLDGETKILEGVYNCRFDSVGQGTDPLRRYYTGTYLTQTSEYHPAAYTIAEKDGLELCIITVFMDRYLMGDASGDPVNALIHEPYLAVMDRDGVEYIEEAYLGKFDAELVSWELPAPVDNTFVFAGFSNLHDGSMIAMLIVGVLVIVACMIFVKRDKTVPYKALDKISAVFNVLMTVAVIPFVTIVTIFSQIVMSGSEWYYQLMLCIPAVSAFTVAASLSLRRKGRSKAGFFVQFAGPALFAMLMLF